MKYIQQQFFLFLGIMFGFVFLTPSVAAETAIYRLYNYETGEHLYTPDANEKTVLYNQYNWGYEGIAWYAPDRGQAVYRLYNPGLLHHLYTTDLNEVETLARHHGWVKDNNGQPVFYSGGSVAIYRLYNHGLRGLHHWTTDIHEYGVLPKHGWQQEGQSFAANRLGKPIQTQYLTNLVHNGNYYQARGKYGYVPIINKKYAVNPHYAPGEIPEARQAFLNLTTHMRNLGFDVGYAYSGFRSYQYQASLYHSYVASDGQAMADRYAARPGHSEHQTGLAFDISDSQGNLLENRASHWLAEHAHEFGFIVRYLPGKEAITGYMHEPWHIRYIGGEATDIYRSGLTLEEYFKVQGGGY